MPKSCVIVGCGSHAYSVISIIESLCEYEIVGLVDTATIFDPNETKSGYRVISTLEKVLVETDSFSEYDFAIAVGDNHDRAEVYLKLLEQGYSLPNFVSSYSIIDRAACLGAANIVGHNTIVNSQAKLGSNNLINTGAVIEHNSEVESHCHIGPSAVVCGSSKISDFCLIGANATLLPNTSLASNCKLAAGAVLTKKWEVEAVSLVGIPAEVK